MMVAARFGDDTGKVGLGRMTNGIIVAMAALIELLPENGTLT